MNAAPRPRFAVMRLTDAAALRARELVAGGEGAPKALRVGVKNGGCAGMEYTMTKADGPVPGDEVVTDKGVTILIDPKAVLFLLGTEMDYVTERMSSRFVFNNPNQTSACGCGESVEIKPARPEALADAR